VVVTPDLGGIAESSTGYRVTAGLEVDEMIAVEVSYIDQGTAKTTDIFGREEFRVYGVMASAVASVELDDSFGAFARVGGYLAKAELDFPDFFNISATDTSVETVIGVGATYQIIDHLDAFVEIDYVTSTLSYGAFGARITF